MSRSTITTMVTLAVSTLALFGVGGNQHSSHFGLGAQSDMRARHPAGTHGTEDFSALLVLLALDFWHPITGHHSSPTASEKKQVLPLPNRKRQRLLCIRPCFFSQGRILSELGRGSNELGWGSKGRLHTKSRSVTDRPTDRPTDRHSDL